ncbi:MAG TPA: FlgD immunoglobulin-like domain containing protein [bacterium]|nr:FlgD immunoglobulin-like domain containing protein [bacterium]HPN42697.1 FlgD immunoglobulin-like domain containing protein [bacterium]
MKLDKVSNGKKQTCILVLLLLTVILVFQTQTANAYVLTFNSSGISWTENEHTWFFDSEWGTISASGYRSSPYCIFQGSNYGAAWVVRKTTGNKIQLNSLWIKSSSINFTVSFYGLDEESQLYNKDVTVTTSYTQVTFDNWTGITKIRGVTPGSNTNWYCDDIDYTLVNVAPNSLTLSNRVLNEDDPNGTTVGTLTTTDSEDASVHTYSFAAGGADNASFTIEGSTLKSAFVAHKSTKSSYSVKIRTTDDGELYLEKTFNIIVFNGYPTRYNVTDAEDEDFNGIYERDGDYGSYPQYIKDGTYYLVNKSCDAKWSLTNGNPSLSFCPGFSSCEDIIVPATGAWMQGGYSDTNPSNVLITEMDESLPVELIGFNASRQNNAVVITWKTASETNHLGFNIERAEKNGTGQMLAWQQIAGYKTNPELQGQGSTTSGHTYTFTDNTADNKNSYYYRLVSVDINGLIDYSQQVEVQVGMEIPEKFALYPAFPNPFNPATTIRYDVAEMCNVTLIITDINGKTVRTLLDKMTPAGSHSVTWSGSNDHGSRVASGVYFYTIQAGEHFVARQKMLLLK